MMSANEILESYVRDVAQYLPRSKRNDVAFELRALLQDELAAKAAALGYTPDQRLAMELLAGFGRPAEAAARYQPRLPLIDPADNHNFLIWALAGGVLFAIAKSRDPNAFLQWVGLIFLCFAIGAWFRRRQPAGRLLWRPKRDPYPETGGRAVAILSGSATLIFPFAMYWAPQTFWKIASLGKSDVSGLALTEAFLHSWQRTVTLAGLAFLVAIYATAALQGGWRTRTRQALIFANLLVGGMLVAHAAPMLDLVTWQTFEIFQLPLANKVAMPVFGLVGGLMVVATLVSAYREWARVSPAPALHGEATA